MIDKTSIGRSVRSMEAQESEPYSRVVVYDSRGNKFESGDESGKTLYLENPFASQAIADRIAQNIVGFSYQPYSAKGAVIDPAAEIGDAISIHGLYSSIFQEDSSYGPQYAANIGAPGEEELNHEIPYISPADRKIIRLNASVGRLGTAIKKETEDRLFDSIQIKASITGLSEYIGRVEAGLDSYVLATDFNEELGKYQTIIASNELAARIDGDVAGLSQRVTQTNKELETVRTASNNLYAALGVEYNEDGSVKTIETIASLAQRTSVTENDLGTITTASNRLYAALNVEKNPDGTIKSVGALAELNQQVETVKSENQTITTAITKIENVVGDASSGLVMRVTQAENGINTNASSITKLTTKVGNLETGFYEFDIMERGKQRHIRSVTIGERVVQRCLCDYALVPMLSRTFIYDNGASMQKKGYTFAANRLTQHLQQHYRKYGTEGYVLLFDFSKFFDRVSHRLIKGILRREFTDERIIALTEHFIDAFGSVGVGLGSQISQIFALASANRLDHYVKEVCRIKGYGRYMDDGYLIHRDKAYLQKCLAGIKALCAELEITLNTKKTQIVKLTHGFTFLKIRYYLQPNGKVVKKIYRRSVTKIRHKLKSFRDLVDRSIMSYEDVYQSFQSWRAYALNFNAHRTILSMNALYNSLFVAPPPT